MISRARLKYLRSLDRKKVRRAEGRLLLEGINAVEEARRAGRLEALFATEAAWAEDRLRALRGSGVPCETLDDAAVRALGETRTPSGVFGLAGDPCRAFAAREFGAAALVLFADGVADPGNLGSLLRSAAGLGADAVAISGDTVDPTNPKVVRASAGAIFRVPVLHAGAAALAEAGFVLWIADAEGEPVERLGTRPPRLALVVGNEPRGVGSAARDLAGRTVAVPLRGRFESLNVAAAGAILLHACAALPVSPVDPSRAARPGGSA